jgi:hypothetical protein
MYTAWAMAAAAVDSSSLEFTFSKSAAVPDTKGALKEVPELAL